MANSDRITVQRYDSTSKNYYNYIYAVENSTNASANTSNITVRVYSHAYASSSGTAWMNANINTAPFATVNLFVDGATKATSKFFTHIKTANSSYPGRIVNTSASYGAGVYTINKTAFDTSLPYVVEWTGDVSHGSDGSKTVQLGFQYAPSSSSGAGRTYGPKAYNNNNVMTFTLTSLKASVGTLSTSSLTASSVAASFSVSGPKSSYGMQLSTASNFSSIAQTKASATSATFTGLSAGTTYYIRGYATSAGGTVYTNTATILTLPTVGTPSVSSIGTTTANASISVSGATSSGIQLSTTNFGTVAKTISSSSGSYSGLSAGTTYYVRGYATNNSGTVYSSVTSFLTKPSVSNPSISSITASSFDTSFTTSGSTTEYGLQVSTTNFGTAVKSYTSATAGSITGLSAGTTYYVRAYATNGSGTAYSSVATVLTQPGVSSISTSSITNSSVYASFTTSGTTTSYGIQLSVSNFGTVLKSSAKTADTLSDLTENTTYYIRGYATNDSGTTYTSVVSFTTLPNKPTVGTLSVSNITENSASFSGSASGTITSKGIQVSTTNFGSAVKSLSDISGTVTGLNESTTYYARAYATNASGTTYSSVISFTTLAGSFIYVSVNGGTFAKHKMYVSVNGGSFVEVKKDKFKVIA